MLIDGAFESNAAVFHNEILWALSRGIHVVGAASMGALRAAELAPLGMVGIGKVFEGYQQGALERDDAVAVVYGPQELGYPLLNVALVDIWATLDLALEIGLLSRNEHALLRKGAAGIFYKLLTFETLINTCIQYGLPEERARVLHQSLPSRRVSQKSEDAVQALTAIAENQASLFNGTHANFIFERTSAWEKLVAEHDESETSSAPLQPSLKVDTELTAIALVLAEREARRRGFVLDQAAFKDIARRFRTRNKLRTSSEVRKWMEIGKLSHDDYIALIEDEFIIDCSRYLISDRLRSLKVRLDRHRRSSLALKML